MKNYYFTIIGFFLVLNIVNSQAFFENQSSSLGLDITTGNSTPHGSGISFCDFDNDGWDDITLGTEDEQSVRFFKNNNGNFIEVFFNITFEDTQNKQVLWVDFDNDGDKDLFITSIFDGNKLYLNDGTLNFIDITNSSGLPEENIHTSGASWGDFNNDGFLDLFLSSYDSDLLEPNHLYKNNGNNTFTEVSSSAGILTSSDLSFCSTFFDYNNDGWQDIYIANDRLFTQNILYRNNGDDTFTDVSEVSNTGITMNAMSTTIDDYNNDGWFDIYITNTSEGNVFFKNNGDGTFTDIAATNGTIFNSIAWGAVFLDAENDTDLDLYVSGVFSGGTTLLLAAFYENDGLGLYSIPDTAGFVDDTSTSYSNAIGDIDNNGLSDIIVNNSSDHDVFIWKNLSVTTNNWLKVKLNGVQSNRDGIGSVIEISINGEKQYRYTSCGEGYISQNSNTEIFGLGDANTIDYIKVTWLSGIVDVINNVNANQVLEIIEGSETLSTNQINDSFDVNVFPNPTKDKVFVNSNFEINTIKITNLLGQTIYNETNIFKHKLSLDVDYLSSGVYNFIISSQEKETVVKVIKE